MTRKGGSKIERDKKRFSWVLVVLIFLCPILMMWCFWTYVWGMRLNVLSFLYYVLGPGLILTRLIFLFRSRRGDWAKVWRALLYALFLFIFLVLGLFGSNEIHRSTHRNAWEKFVSSMPENSKRRIALGTPELGTPEEMTYHHHIIEVAVFRSDSHILLCRYSPDDYARQKATLEQQYAFRTEALIGLTELRDEETAFVEPYEKIGNDEFRFIVPQDGANKYGDRYFKTCLLFVTNDETCEIGFLAFVDDDLDEAKDLSQFLKEYCGWKDIR